MGNPTKHRGFRGTPPYFRKPFGYIFGLLLVEYHAHGILRFGFIGESPDKTNKPLLISLGISPASLSHDIAITLAK